MNIIIQMNRVLSVFSNIFFVIILFQLVFFEIPSVTPLQCVVLFLCIMTAGMDFLNDGFQVNYIWYTILALSIFLFSSCSLFFAEYFILHLTLSFPNLFRTIFVYSYFLALKTAYLLK